MHQNTLTANGLTEYLEMETDSLTEADHAAAVENSIETQILHRPYWKYDESLYIYGYVRSSFRERWGPAPKIGDQQQHVVKEKPDNLYISRLFKKKAKN